MDNAWVAVREGGVVIILGECEEGVGSDQYLQWMEEYRTPEKIEEKTRCEFIVGGHKAYAVTRLMKKAKFILVSALTPDLALDSLVSSCKGLGRADIAYAKLGPNPQILLMPQGGLTVPTQKVNRRERRDRRDVLNSEQKNQKPKKSIGKKLSFRAGGNPDPVLAKAEAIITNTTRVFPEHPMSIANKSAKVQKRDGSVVPFNPEKVDRTHLAGGA